MTTTEAENMAGAIDHTAIVLKKVYAAIEDYYRARCILKIDYCYWAENMSREQRDATKLALTDQGWAAFWDDEPPVHHHYNGMYLYVWNPKDFGPGGPYETSDQRLWRQLKTWWKSKQRLW